MTVVAALIGAAWAVVWRMKKRRFRKDELVNVTEGRQRVIRRGGGF